MAALVEPSRCVLQLAGGGSALNKRIVMLTGVLVKAPQPKRALNRLRKTATVKKKVACGGCRWR